MRLLAVTALASAAIGTPLAFADTPTTTTPTTGTAGETTTTVPAPIVTLILGSRPLGVGARGTDVKQLQRLLRRRGFAIAVDGAYGPMTRGAVRSMQRRFRMRAHGVATLAFLKRLGVREVRSGASPVVTPPPATTYPLAGPNAAKAKYLKAFPVGGKHTYFDDFGAPRSQGSHQGNDIMADRGIPVRAVANGTIRRLTRTETGLGGIWIWLRDTGGNDYYFAHMTTITPGIEVGVQVTAGQQIGTVGNTGDARYGAPHLHFEVHPGGGSAIDPYTDLLAVDPEPPVRK